MGLNAPRQHRTYLPWARPRGRRSLRCHDRTAALRILLLHLDVRRWPMQCDWPLDSAAHRLTLDRPSWLRADRDIAARCLRIARESIAPWVPRQSSKKQQQAAAYHRQLLAPWSGYCINLCGFLSTVTFFYPILRRRRRMRRSQFTRNRSNWIICGLVPAHGPAGIRFLRSMFLGVKLLLHFVTGSGAAPWPNHRRLRMPIRQSTSFAAIFDENLTHFLFILANDYFSACLSRTAWISSKHPAHM